MGKKEKIIIVEKTPEEKCLEKLENDMVEAIDLPKASYFGLQKELDRLLANEKAKVDVLDATTGYTPFMLAAMKGHQKAVELLKVKGANVNYQAQGGQTAVHLAAANEHIELVKWLATEAKVDIEVEDDAGNTAINDAARKGHLKVIDALAGCNGNIEHANKAGCTPFLNATLSNRGAAVDVLVRLTCQLDVTDKQGNSALHIAAMLGYEKLVRQLLGCMAHLVGMVNKDGKKATEVTTDKAILDIFDKLSKA